MAVGTRGTRRQPGRRAEHEPFPVAPLKDVAKMARVIDGRGGRCRFDELAAALEQKSKSSGAFRNRTAAGRMFGAVKTEGGELVLTDLGQRMASPSTEGEALVDAFLSIRLYESLYVRYAADGNKLPANDVIEDDMIRLDVPPHNAQKARQVFLRSAEDAGFFRAGRDRLIRPSAASTGPAAGTIASMQVHPPEPREAIQAPRAEAVPVAEHWLVKGWLTELPPRDEPPTPAQFRHLLETLRMNLETLYGIRADEGEKPAAQPNLNGAPTVQRQPS